MGGWVFLGVWYNVRYIQGDFGPSTTPSKVFTAFFALFGVTLIGMCVAAVAAVCDPTPTPA